MMSNTKYTGLEIAVIGMSGRFPGAKNISEYWENIKNGKESIYRFSDEELIKNGVSQQDLDAPEYVKSTCVVEDKEFFDSNFFNYTPHEAAIMDPQIRIFHECVWEALEDAASIDKIKNYPVGLFAGASGNFDWRAYTMISQDSNEVDFFRASQLNDAHFISSLVSYKLDLKGPAVYVNTACSTSLVAVHMACRSLLTGDAKIAIAGGVAMHSGKVQGYMYQEEGILSNDGHCRAFNVNSTGTMVGQGAAVVVLKKLQDALKDGDRIYSVIKGSAINNDGSRKVGYTAPSVDGQVECIRVAHKMAKIEPGSIGYIEAHGTGTKLGDPIEALALQKIFNNGKEFSAAIGTVKSNIGHLDAAAGVSGLIRTVLSLWNKQLPPAVHSADPIAELSWGANGFYLNKELKDWASGNGSPLRAGVSSFGIGGTNAHVVLEEAPLQQFPNEERKNKLLTISAKTEKSLQRYQSRLLDFISREKNISLTDLCYTLQTGRKDFTYRRQIVFTERAELIDKLSATNAPFVKSKDRSNALVFMFSGAGSQYANMGRGLYESEPLFKEEIDKGFALLSRLTGINYAEILYPVAENDARINEMLHTQPMIFLFEYSLARLIMSWGIQPAYMIGHSIGEYVAACISGVFDFEDALKLVVKRGELMNKMLPGAMLSASLSEAEAGEYLNDRLSVAAVNAPEQIVFSGDAGAVDALINELEKEEIGHVKLYASHAGHSPMINDILDEYENQFKDILFHEPKIPFVSNLTGKVILPEEAMSVSYWLSHMRQTVRFSDGIKVLLQQPSEKIFIEIGGGHSLSSLLRQQPGDLKPLGINLIRHPKEAEDDCSYLADRIGQIWSHGVEISWSAFYGNAQRSKISAPTYSFEKIKYPAEVNIYENGFSAGSALRKTADKALQDWIYYPVWKSSVLQTKEPLAGPRTYLVFSMVDPLSRSVSASLRQKGETVIEIVAGPGYKKESAASYFIDPCDAQNYKLLFEDLKSEGNAVTDVLHFWSIGVDAAQIERSQADDALSLVYFSLVYIAKNWLQDEHGVEKRFSVITANMHNVVGNENAGYASSLLFGVLNSLPNEYFVSSFNIDINENEQSGKTASQLVREICYNQGDRYVALRNGKRWLRDYQQHGPQEKPENSIKQNGTILITGGIGNVGMALSEHLIKKYDSKIAIAGRREINAEIEAALRSLNKNGVAAVYYQADVAEPAALKRIVSEIEKNQGTISGLIHAAGITDIDYFELIEDLSMEKARGMFAPKVQGITSVYEVFKEKNLDFAWITSSLTSILGGLGHSSFSAANLFMDHFVASKAEELYSWKCVNLPEMVFGPEDQMKEVKSGRRVMKPGELCELFDRSVAISGHPQLLVSPVDLFTRINEVYTVTGENNAEAGFDSETVEKLERPNLKNAYAAPVTETEKKLIAMVESFFGMGMIGVDDNFFELGGDSLKAMVLLKRIKKELGINLTVKDFFKRPTVRMLAAEIDELTSLLVKKERTSKIVI